MKQRKACRTCGLKLPLQEFWRDRTRRDGFAPVCRTCARLYYRAWYASHRDQVIERVLARRRAYQNAIRLRQALSPGPTPRGA